jgi:hypothetical protein
MRGLPGRYGCRMRSGNSFVAGAVSGLVGLALMVVETVRVLNGSTLSGINSVLLFVGLGLVALGGALLVYAVLVDTGPVDIEPLDDEPVDDADAIDDPAEADDTAKEGTEVAEPADDPA